MRKLFLGVLFLLIVSGCNNNKINSSSIQSTKQEDTVSAVMDSVTDNVEENAVDEIPSTADETFADFFYSFSTNKKLQMARVKFPLSVTKGKKIETLDKEHWHFNTMFSKLPIYSVIYDRASDMELEKDLSVKNVHIEWIYLVKKQLKSFHFEKEKGLWKLESLNVISFNDNDDSGNENFYSFYHRFANDSVFQQERLSDPLKFVTVDPDDEFKILETTLEQGQWFAFKPDLPLTYLTNVLYGQPLSEKSNKKIIEIKGFGNGYNNTLYFVRRNGQWKLTQFEDLSD